MGGSESGVPDDYKEQHWNRPVAKLFSSAKMTEPLGIAADFVVPFLTKQGAIYGLISRGGLITALSHALPDVLYNLEIPNVDIKGAVSFDATTAILWTENAVIKLNATEDAFEWEKRDLSFTPFECLVLNATTFAIIGTDGSIWTHEVENKETAEQVYNATGKETIKCSLSGSLIAISSAEDITLFSFSGKTGKVITYETNDIALIGESHVLYVSKENTIKLIKVNEALEVIEEKDLWTKKITRMFKPNDKCVMWVCQNEFLSYIVDSQRQNPILRASMPVQTSILDVIQLSNPRIMALICSEGNTMVLRHPQYQTRKGEIEFSPLYSYHRVPIKCGCTAEEFSFFTYDENGIAVLWESFPDWWTAPFYLGMFDDPNANKETM